MNSFGYKTDIEASICLDQCGLSWVAVLAPEWPSKVQAYNREGCMEVAALSLLAAGPSSVLLIWHKSFGRSHTLDWSFEPAS